MALAVDAINIASVQVGSARYVKAMNELTDFRSILQLIRRRALYFLIPFVLVAAVGAAVVMTLPAVYSAQATILVESQRIPSDLVKSTITALATERLQVIQQRVLTRDNILAIVDKFGLFGGKPTLSRTEAVDLAKL